MDYEQVVELLRKTGLPYAYDHFEEGEAPDPPFLVYLYPGSHNFAADGKVYFKVRQLDVELYTDVNDPVLEERLEQLFDEAGIVYAKTESFLESEKMYEVLYETEV